MSKRVNRRDFIKTSALLGGLSILPIQFSGCQSGPSSDFLYTLPEYDIFYKFKEPQKLVRYNLSKLKESFPDADNLHLWMLRAVTTIFQGLINRKEPRIFIQLSAGSTDWLRIYQKEGIDIPFEEETDFKALIKRFAGELNGYVALMLPRHGAVWKTGW